MIQMVNNSIKMQINLPSENFAFLGFNHWGLTFLLLL